MTKAPAFTRDVLPLLGFHHTLQLFEIDFLGFIDRPLSPCAHYEDSVDCTEREKLRSRLLVR